LSFDWTEAEEAVHTWITAASSLEADKVVWLYGGQPRPTGTFIGMAWDGPFDTHGEYEKTSTDLARDPGEEIEFKIRADKELILRLQCFSDSVTGNSSSTAILSRVKTAMRLNTHNANLNTAGLHPFSVQNISYLPEIIGAGFEARATLDLNFFIVEELVEYTGYIQTVSGTYTISGAITETEDPFLFEIE
jgi:hypothetical protein